MNLDQLLGAAASFVSAIVITSTPATIAPTPPPKPAELVRLEQFLEKKASPIPADTLYSYSNWKAILSVANAESGYGKKIPYQSFNAWGINDYRKGSQYFGKTRRFESWEESLAYTSQLLFKYDPEDGMPAPKQMVARWKVIQPFWGWENNVNYAIREIEQHTGGDVAVAESQSLL